MNEEVEFENMPGDAEGWNTNTKVRVEGLHAIKTVTRTLELKGGRKDDIVKTFERELTL